MILYIRPELIAIDSNLEALCRVGCKNIIRTRPGGGEGGGKQACGEDSDGVLRSRHIVRRVGGYRVGRGSDKYLLDTGRGFVLAIETVMYTLHLFRRLCLCIQITAQPGTFFRAVETTPCVISLSFRGSSWVWSGTEQYQ